MLEPRYVYKASILARRMLNSSGTEEGYLIEHEPFLIDAESMQAAERAAESLAFERWKKEDGWQDHEAYIALTDRDDYKAITGTQITGPVIRYRGDSDDEPKVVKFG